MPAKRGRSKAVTKAGTKTGKKRGAPAAVTGPKTKAQRTANINTQLRQAIEEVKSKAVTKRSFTPDKKLEAIFGANKITTDKTDTLDVTADCNRSYGIFCKPLGETLAIFMSRYYPGGHFPTQTKQVTGPVWMPNILRKSRYANGTKNFYSYLESKSSLSTNEQIQTDSSFWDAFALKKDATHPYIRSISDRYTHGGLTYRRSTYGGSTYSGYSTKYDPTCRRTDLPVLLGDCHGRTSTENFSALINIENSISKLTTFVNSIEQTCRHLDQNETSSISCICNSMKGEIHAVRSEILDLKGIQKHTRSHGPVKDYPLVPKYALEYERIPNNKFS